MSLPHRREVKGIGGQLSAVTEGVRLRIDIDGHEEDVYLYVSNHEEDFDLILGLPWMRKRGVTLSPAKRSIYIHDSGVRIRSYRESRTPRVKQCTAEAYRALLRRCRRLPDDLSQTRVFTASMADIKKALAPKKKVDPLPLLPDSLKPLYKYFLKEEADKLPPHRGLSVDHKIELEKKDGKEQEIPWGPLYSMSRQELLVLRKELTSHLDRGFIRVSNSAAAAPVLFVRKPGGGLRFCVDYRALNRITKKDRYPLPLIRETLDNIGKAKWFTKVDVVQAFHKIRIAEGEEWKTAFRTRFGLFEWMVTPFGLANAPATFQRYINYVLRQHLDDFCSAYIDDVLVYSSGSKEDHEEKVHTVVRKLGEAGLQLDIGKSEFSVKKTKYLGFIIEAGVGVSMDPEKVKAIHEWEAPKTARGVRSFLGFANFYRQFIWNYSGIASPLTKLTGKNSEWVWGAEQQKAFKSLKEMFLKDPCLAHFDETLETVLECDASVWATGGTLSQKHPDGSLRTVAYYSSKNSPAEVNYTVHDKELLAVIKCVEEWRPWMKMAEHVDVLTDHKNLEYFATIRKLSERHVRWSDLLSEFNLTFQYRAGTANGRADALSRREQDVPDNADPRVSSRHFQLLHPMDPTLGAAGPMRTHLTPTIRVLPARVEDPSKEAKTLWNEGWQDAAEGDEAYQAALAALRSEARKFPPHLGLKVALAECAIDEQNRLLYRGRKWVPNSEPLRTGLIAEVHNSPAAAHPGRENTYRILSRDYFFPGMSPMIRTFVRNCDICGRSKPWREMKQGFLKPLPIPDRAWKDLSMDFVGPLPSCGGLTFLMVITCRLSKDVTLVALPDIKAPTVAKAFWKEWVAHHWLPDTIISDRGSQFVSEFWTELTHTFGIRRDLSTAEHPQTDGATERMNSAVETMLRQFVNWEQNDWALHLPAIQIAIKGRDSASTGVSPFFLQHGYNQDPVNFAPNEDSALRRKKRTKPEEAARAMADKFVLTMEFAQAKMAEAQQEQEKYANKHRKESPRLRVGDKVWLQLGDSMRNKRPNKKLDHKNVKFEVIEANVNGNPLNVRLNTPPPAHNVFHVDRLRLAENSYLPSQPRDDWQPEAILVDGEEEFEVEEIMAEKRRVRGRGYETRYEVKWVGYSETTWEHSKLLEESEALDKWTEYSRPWRTAGGELPAEFRRNRMSE
jgi:transposase InsO family protein